MLIVILIVKKCLECFMKKTNQMKFRAEKVIKRNDNKLYVKWEGYDCSFNSWIDKKRHNINE